MFYRDKKCHLLIDVFPVRAPNSRCIQSHRLARDFEFAMIYTKGEAKVCVLGRNPWLAKMEKKAHSRFQIRTSLRTPANSEINK